MAAPVRPSERLITLDIVRGIAILAVVFVNVSALAGPQFLLVDPYAWNPPSTADLAVHHFVNLFIAGKFISIFALLFGMGLALQTSRIEQDSASAPVYRRRQAWLFVFGVLHGVFFWYGDILNSYAIVGSLVFLVRHQPARDLRRLGAVLIAMGSILNASAFLAIGAIPDEVYDAMDEIRAIDIPPEAPDWVFRMLAQTDIFRMVSVAEVQAFGDGPWWFALWMRLAYFLTTAFSGVTTVGLWVGGLMLVGVAWIREDFVHDEARQRWWALKVLPTLLVVELLVVLGHVLGDFRFGSLGDGLLSAISWICKPPLGLAYFAAFCLLVPRLKALAVFAPAGRMALTNYIGQSLVLNVLFVHWGLGWFGTMGRAATFGICVLLVTVQLLFSALWLRRFRRGPLEWVWRWLTYGNAKSGGSRTSS